jgi:hypothetical protein
MRTFRRAALVLGLLFGSAWAKDCTVSNKFELHRSQVLSGILEDPIPAPLSGCDLELRSRHQIVGRALTNNDGEYSFGEVAAGRYRIHIRYGGDALCAPKVKCNASSCSTQRQLRPNPKKLVTVF